MVIFNTYHVFAPFVKRRGCRFLYFFSLCDIRNESVFLLLEHSILREVKQKKHIKNMKFWFLNPSYKRSDWKIQLTERFSEALTSKPWNKKKYILPKLTEMERNWITFTPLWYDKKSLTDPFKGSPRGIHGKKQSRQYHLSKITRLDWSKTAKQFSVNSRGKFICQYQASRQASALPEFFFLRILDTFQPFKLLF